MIENAERVTVGEGCRLHEWAAIGGPAQHATEWLDPAGRIVIGSRVRAFAFATIDLPLTDEAETVVGDGCTLMHFSHVAHDCVLGPRVTLANAVQLAGHVRVHEGATLGLGVLVRQRQTIGAYAMIGQGSNVVDDVPPFQTWAGNPAKQIGWNVEGMKRAGVPHEAIECAKARRYADHPLTLAMRSAFIADCGRYVRASR